MAAPEAARKPQGNRTRRPAVPVAIPLTYAQKHSQRNDASKKKKVATTVTECPLSLPTSPPTAPDDTTGQQPAAATNDTLDASLDDRTQNADRTEGQTFSADVSKLGQGSGENIESPENGLGPSRSTTAASSDTQVSHTCAPVYSKHSQGLQGAVHEGQPSRRSRDSSFKMAGSMTSPPGPALDSHNPVLPTTITSAHLAQPSIAGARTSISNGSKSSIRRGSGAANRHRTGTSQSGQPDLRASSLAAATIKALQELSDARRGASGIEPAQAAPLSPSQARQDGNPQHVAAPTAHFATTPVMLQRHVQDLRNGMISPDGGDVAAYTGHHSIANFGHGSPAIPHRMHQPHPSQGSMSFGSYPGSVHSSPAPHLSAGGHHFGPYPPPPQPMHPAMSTFPAFPPGLGWSPQPTPQMMHSPSHNNFAHHAHTQSFGPSPSRTPGLENHQHFGHSPAHSLHAQTPILQMQHLHASGADEAPLAGMMNGTGAPAPYPFDRQLFRGPPMRPSEAGDALDGLPNYIQMQFNNPSFADVQLQVLFSGNDGKQLQHILIPGHSMLFARSPCLGQLMAQGFTEVMQDGMPSRLIVLDLQGDRFVRPDAFWLALQRLYGGSFLIEEDMPGQNASQIDASVKAERFDLSVAYAAAGHILQMEPLVHRGIGFASLFLDWDTLLKALEISGCSDAELFRGAGEDLAYYGYESRDVLGLYAGMYMNGETIRFLRDRIPVDFQLDTSVADPEQIRRLPKPNTFVKKHNQKLSAMKFGEFGLDDDVEDTNAKKTSPAAPASPHAILSGFLLNLPFPQLKYVLESKDLCSKEGGLDATQRSKIITDVIRERERRRDEAARSWQHRPLNASRLMAKSSETQQEKTLWWMESVVKRGDRVEMMRELVKIPDGHELPA